MATGFMQRFKGKIATVWGGVFQNGAASSGAFHNAGAPTNGTSGTLAGIAPPGALLIDTTNKTFYQNTNTLASPTWTALTTATGAGTYTGTYNGTIGATTPADGKFTTIEASGIITESSVDAITAGATQTQAGATALTGQINRVTTNATAGNGVKLMAAAAGLSITIINATANALQVYGVGTDTINAVAFGTGVSVPANKTATFNCTLAGAWNMMLSA